MPIEQETIKPSFERTKLYGTASSDGWAYDQAGYTYDQVGLMYDQTGGRTGQPPTIFLEPLNQRPSMQAIEDIRP